MKKRAVKLERAVDLLIVMLTPGSRSIAASVWARRAGLEP
jgi:hypothetical protein